MLLVFATENCKPVSAFSGLRIIAFTARGYWIHTSLYIKRGKVSVRTYVRTSVTVGVASSVANDVTMRMTS